MRSREICEDFIKSVQKRIAHGVPKRQAIYEVAADIGKEGSTGYDIIRQGQHYGLSLCDFAPSIEGRRNRPIKNADIPLDHRNSILKLKKQIVEIARNNLEVAEIRKEIFGLASKNPEPPAWTAEAKNSSGVIGTPVVIWSDWHLGEIINPGEVNGINSFNLKIAESRIKRLVDRTLDVCFNHMVSPKYPGIVVNLLGDIVSGDIHHELELTNEEPLFPIILRAVDYLVASLKLLADHFGRVHVIAAPGNHGRQTHKPEFKRYTVRNADWLIATLAEKAFVVWLKDKRVTFSIPESGELIYPIYEKRFLATHGDALGVRGGDGIIGLIGPITRGEIKVARSFAQIGKDYDMALMGHWHQLLWLQRVIVNGSLKGYDEYAHRALRATFELPQQALFFVHPKRGITFRVPILLEDGIPKACQSQKSFF